MRLPVRTQIIMAATTVDLQGPRSLPVLRCRRLVRPGAEVVVVRQLCSHLVAMLVSQGRQMVAHRYPLHRPVSR